MRRDWSGDIHALSGRSVGDPGGPGTDFGQKIIKKKSFSEFVPPGLCHFSQISHTNGWSPFCSLNIMLRVFSTPAPESSQFILKLVPPWAFRAKLGFFNH